MDIIKENEARFLKQERKLASKLAAEQILLLDEEWESNQGPIRRDLEETLLDLYQQSAAKKAQGMMESARYLQFSYLRSAVLDRSPCYRVDLYDHRWFASDIECGVSWDPAFAFEKLQKIWDRLKEDFERQSSAPGYRLDELVLELGDRFHFRVMSYLCVMLPAILQTEAFEKKFENVKVYGGEYLDQFYLLYAGGEES